MSTNRKFRVQNGIDVTGEVVVGTQTVITSDGKLTQSSVGDVVATALVNDIASLQAQVDSLLGTSPEHLNTLQEIVALFQTADGSLTTLISQNIADISAMQSNISLKASSTDVTTLSTSVTEVKELVSGTDSDTTTLATTATTVVTAINELHTGLESISGGLCINYDSSTKIISIDETESASALHVASSGDTNTLEGQSADYYRLDVYDIAGSLIN